MARVPYSPVPDAQPNLQPTRPVFVNTPIAAFGGETAQALGLLGRTLDQAGGELATRAVAMQEVHNEATARATAVNFSNDAARLFADFRNKQGADAGPAAYQDYQNQLSALRDKYRNGLNPMAANLYDAQSYSVLERTNLWGAMHSGQQLDEYNKVTAAAGAESARNIVALNPNDEAAFDAAMKQSDSAIATKFRGMGPDEIKVEQAKGRSTVAVTRLKAMADLPNGAPAADQMLGKAIKDGDLRGEDIGPVRDYIRRQMNEHTSRTIAHGVFDGTSQQLGIGTVDIARAREAIAANETGGQPGQGYLIVGLRSTNKAGQTGEPLGRYGIMSYNLAPWLAKAGLPPMTAEQFLQHPDVQDRVFDKIFGDDMARTGSFNKAAGNWLGHGVDALGTTTAAYVAKANAALGRSGTLTEKIAAAKVQAGMMAPDDTDLPDIVEQRIRTLDAEQNRVQRQNDLEAKNTIDEAIMNQLGQGPMTLTTMLQNPNFAAAYKGMDSKGQFAVGQMLLRAARSDNEPSSARTENTNRLTGQMYVDPEGFKKVNLFEENLTQQQRSALFGQQSAMIKGKTIVDPALGAALKDPDVRAQMSAAGLTDRTTDDYKQFVGAMQNEILEARARGKEITPEDFGDIASKLLQTSGHWYLFNRTPAKYTVPLENIPETFQAQARKDLAAKYPDGNIPDSAIEHYWALSLWNDANLKAKANAR